LLTDFLFSYNFYFVYFNFSIFYSTCSSCVWQLQLQKWNEKWNEWLPCSATYPLTLAW